MSVTRLSISCLALSLLVCLFAAQQQDNKNQKSDKKSADQPETNARPMTDKERKAKQKQLRKEIGRAHV